MMSFWQLFVCHLKVVYRNRSGFFWTVIMPVGMYIVLSVLPLDALMGINYSDFILPGIAAFAIMQGGIYTLAYWMVDLRSRGVIKRFQATPLKKSELILSLVAARAVVMLVQVALLTLIGILVFRAPVEGSLLLAVIFVVTGAFVFLPLGLVISTFGNTYDAVAPITAGVGFVFGFLSNIFYPIEVIPEVLQTLSKILPTTYLADGLRNIYLTPGNWEKILTDLAFLLIWALVINLLTMWRFKFEE
ncbi:MAG: ABC transporter permease [Candidatus Doudnabacteria bacterium]|nr:ABC transporter permease [Candidatus Doudnabacteria bacterium]